VVCVVDEERHARDLLSLVEFAKKQHGELGRSRLKQPNVEELIGVEGDCGEQPAFFRSTRIVVSSTAIRFGSTSLPGCRSAFCTQS
jgi:hypothetical protein